MMNLFRFCALIFIFQIQQGVCNKQAYFLRKEQKYLANHVIETKQADSELECGIHCVADGSCASVNYKSSGVDKGRCELNDKTVREVSDEETHNPDFVHLVVVKRIPPTAQKVKSPVRGFDPAPPAFIGGKQEMLSSCKEVLEKNTTISNGVYTLRNNDSLEEYQVYCHMTEIFGCGSAGWTLVMKIDGNQTEFNYSSPYWSNKETYAVEDGLDGLTEKQTRLASYWNTPFEKICLGMKVNGVTKWIVINHQASSLFNVIADGTNTTTAIGKDTWKLLIANSSLQMNCNDEGFNVKPRRYVRVRLGLVANNENDCDTCDSYIGFGASSSFTSHINPAPTCGNLAVHKKGSHYNEDTDLPAFGYIFVQ